MLTMFGLKQGGEVIYKMAYYVDRLEMIALIVGTVCATPVFAKMLSFNEKHKVLNILIDVWLLVLFVVSTSYIAASTYNPFIYFRF